MLGIRNEEKKTQFELIWQSNLLFWVSELCRLTRWNLNI